MQRRKRDTFSNCVSTDLEQSRWTSHALFHSNGKNDAKLLIKSDQILVHACKETQNPILRGDDHKPFRIAFR